MPDNFSAYPAEDEAIKNFIAYADDLVRLIGVALKPKGCDISGSKPAVSYSLDEGLTCTFELTDKDRSLWGQIRSRRRDVATLTSVIPPSEDIELMPDPDAKKPSQDRYLRLKFGIDIHPASGAMFISHKLDIPLKNELKPFIVEKIIEALTDETGRPLWLPQAAIDAKPAAFNEAVRPAGVLQSSGVHYTA